MNTRYGRDAALHIQPRPALRFAAVLLHGASLALRHLAQRLLRLPPATPAHEPVLEFHAHAGAPEGALYVDGRLVGTLTGISRL